MKISVVVPKHTGSAAQRLRRVAIEEQLPCEIIVVSPEGADIFDFASGGSSGPDLPTRHIATGGKQLSTATALQFGAANSQGDIVFLATDTTSLNATVGRCRSLWREYQTGYPADTLRMPVVASEKRSQAALETGYFGSNESATLSDTPADSRPGTVDSDSYQCRRIDLARLLSRQLTMHGAT